ncbi:MAG: hypothetical protein HKP58_06915, partial [Desulfatitalea sp.]|nr:hypothetical protein [Desulfatitalea sp.]NNK00127.1 hypothetical protein [Desulfatitalea sp.]
TGTGPGPGGDPSASGPEVKGDKRPSAAAAASAADALVDDATGKAQGRGTLLLHQLELMHREVEKHLQGESDVGLPDLAQAIFDMKKQLLEGIKSQKALGVAYRNEEAILESANRLTDQVLIELIREEYQSGKITVQRLAHIIRRMIPEASDLKRLLPQIKTALLAEGMSVAEYLTLIDELSNELQNEELTRLLQESSESVGLDGDALIEEVKKNPTQAAELIYLASQMRKSGGDESALSDILVEYVEQIGNRLTEEAQDDSPEGQEHIKSVMTQVETSVLAKLNQMNLNTDTLLRMEERINQRMESILDKMRVQWLAGQADQPSHGKVKQLTVLQTMERNVDDDEELVEILKIIRAKVDAGEIEENNFRQINDEIFRLKRQQLDHLHEAPMPIGIMTSEDIMFTLEKEIAKGKRYGVPFSALAFAFVTAKPVEKVPESKVTNADVLEVALERMADTFREVDYIGQVGRNKMMVLLPMMTIEEGKKALSRVLRVLHGKPLVVRDVPMQLRVAGVAGGFDDQTTDAKTFVKHLSNDLADMVTRVKSIQVLF